MQRKAKDLESLLRLHNWTVDERRRELGVLLAREEDMILSGEEMDRQLIREQQTAAADPAGAGFIYSAYAKGYLVRREQLERALDALRGEILQARDRLADAYRQLKVFEEVQKGRQRQEDIEEGRKEQALFDEIAQTQYRQRKARRE
ncbi:MAG: hypothetical protein F8N37_08095 [Telmatospirillum sp.]|nr:hypothetical protein [Telmatospirillum sp.]